MISRQDAQTYLTFIYQVLVPHTNKADLFYSVHQESIERTAALLREEFGYELKKLYRGILLDSTNVTDGVLEPINTIRYLSFTELRKVAQRFADVDDPMSWFGMNQSPRFRGYLIEHTPDPSEVLFHHSWAERLGLYRMNLLHLDRSTVEEQQEVVLRQNGRRFEVKAVTNNVFPIARAG